MLVKKTSEDFGGLGVGVAGVWVKKLNGQSVGVQVLQLYFLHGDLPPICMRWWLVAGAGCW